MYAGRIVETGAGRRIFTSPQHPYTEGLLGSMPRLDERWPPLPTIAGQPPNLQRLPPGCAFNDRCAFVFDRCASRRPGCARPASAALKACHLARPAVIAAALRVQDLKVHFPIPVRARAVPPPGAGV